MKPRYNIQRRSHAENHTFVYLNNSENTLTKQTVPAKHNSLKHYSEITNSHSKLQSTLTELSNQ